MPIETSHGSARPTLPRSSDLAVPETVGEPSGVRDARGRFASANGIGRGARWKHLLAESLGRDLTGEAGQLGREAYRLYRSFLADLPCDCASVRAMVAARARAAVLAARFARKAAEVGLDSAEGATALAEAARWDARAERLGISSLDVSARLAKAARSRPIDAHAAVVEAFGDRDEDGEVGAQ